MIIDMHVHFFPENVAPKVTQHLADHYGIDVPYQGTLAEYSKMRLSSRVDTAVFFTAATKPEQVQSANIWAKSNTGGAYIGFGTLHPDYHDIDGEIKKLKDWGVKGVKFHPDFQQFYLDDAKALTIYEKMAKDFIIIFHVGDEENGNNTVYSSPRRLANVLDNIPNLRVIAAHMGGYKMWDLSMQWLVGKEVYFDTSSTFGILPDEQFKNLIKEHGYHRILLGSDYPYNDPQRELRCLSGLGLKDKQYQAIIGENAKKLLAGVGL
ncbi:amidohydrolase family protein [Desulfofalx alkaliphila]|uniref:amidohydrolase family protein n=1 Tax=Desulfofalx alkaliphila TaxID=105483 RepID=UPI0004E1B9C2|nr:amidohydrolase family protein [Desulfofalx alkaliphila]